MFEPFVVNTETVVIHRLNLGQDTNEVLWRLGNYEIIGKKWPTLINSTYGFNYDDDGILGIHRFGCSQGAFTYADLLEATKEICGVPRDQITVLRQIAKPNGRPITTPVVEESENFFITKGGKAFEKSIWHRVTEAPKTIFTVCGSGEKERLEYNNRTIGHPNEVLRVLYQVQQLIEFMEDAKTASIK